ncbi:glycosyltransferase [Nibricoccus sp. IMCC34717]|uniref:glycosyltransferase n=1 Tax=Nibricoccus sp. IMCC34717 TaxID=3034021 RepID=UPI00384EA689
MPPSTRSYLLVTPVKDEEQLIGRTIASVAAQTILPAEWVIVSDGSTDRTNEVVAEAARRHPWITLVALPPRPGRSFAAVVNNTELGIRQAKAQDSRYIGLLDSDVEFPPHYFQTLMERMEADPKLGLCGGAVIDIGLPKNVFPRNRRDIPGATQFFRRECFAGLGGMIAVPEGGWDALTCMTARKNGWRTVLFTDLVMDHLKPRNISQGGVWRRKAQMGERDYALGYHPLFETAKCLGRAFSDRPPLIAGLAWWIGFLGATLRKPKRVVPEDVIRATRKEQLRRLIGMSD